MRARKGGGGRAGWGKVNREEGFWRTLSGARPWRPRKATKSISWKARGVNDGGATQGILVPSPTHDLCPLITDHYQTSGVFQKSQLPTKASVWQVRLHLVTSPGDRNVPSMLHQERRGLSSSTFDFYWGLFFLMLGKIVKEKSWAREWEPYQSVFNSSFVFISLLFQKLWILIKPLP